MKPVSLIPALALAAAIAGAACAQAAPEIDRVGAGTFPISTVVVAKGVGGADLVYVSGATAPSAKPGTPVTGDTKTQTIAALGRIAEVLKGQGLGLGDIVMMRVYLIGDPATGGKMDFAGMMEGYKQFFGTADQPNKPSRTTVQVAALAGPGALVEIEAQAIKTHP